MYSRLTKVLFSAIILIFIIGFGFNDDNPIKKTFNYQQFDSYYPPRIKPLIAVDTLNESFESTTFPPTGWTKQNVGGGTGWNRQTAGTTPVPGFNGGTITVPPGGGNAVGFVSYVNGGSSSSDQYLMTPQINNVQSNDSLKFWLRWWPNSYGDTIDIRISTTDNQPASFTINAITYGYLANTLDTIWGEKRIRIGNLVPPGSNIYIAFREHVADNVVNGATFSLDLVRYTKGAGSVTCSNTWGAQTSGVTAQLNTVKAVNDLVVWTAGNGAVVRRTVNGGTTWTNANPNTGVIRGDVYNIEALDSSNAWCTTSPDTTFIYKTTNGGTNWTRVFAQAGGFIDAIQMVNANAGYALGDPVGGTWTLLVTADGGSSWTQMPTAPAAVGSEAGWNNCFQVSLPNMWFGTSNTKVYYSTNQGITWSSAATTGTANSVSLQFNSTTLGMVGGSILLKSTNGGVNYTTVTIPGSGNITGIDGVDTSFWCTRGTSIYATTNSGTNWTTAFTAGGTLTDVDMAFVGGCPRIWAVGTNGTIVKNASVTGITGNNNIPNIFALKQNYPNPFNPATLIKFELPFDGNVSLKVFDLLGREVQTLVNEQLNSGSYQVHFDGSKLSSGVYFYKLETEGFTETRKMMLIK